MSACCGTAPLEGDGRLVTSSSWRRFARPRAPPGDNDLSVVVRGAVYTFDHHWQHSCPCLPSGNTHGVVIEFTCPGLPLREKPAH